MRLLKYASKEWRKICRRFNRHRIVDKIKCFFGIKNSPAGFKEHIGALLQDIQPRAEAIGSPSKSEEAVIPCIEITGEEHNTEDDDIKKPTYTIEIDFTPLINAAQQIAETFAKFAASWSDLLSNISDYQEFNAWIWALKYHPEWCAIYNRTKKRRIKKKYKDRIMRAYAAFNESEG